MRINVFQIAKPAADNSLFQACYSLNVLQTVWRFVLMGRIERPRLGDIDLNAFSPQTAFDLLPNELGVLSSQPILRIGGFRGRVDTNGIISIYSREEAKAIASEFWWPEIVLLVQLG